MVEELFVRTPISRQADATVTAVEERGVRLDRSIFYPTGGGQPGDTGVLRWDGGEAKVVDASRPTATTCCTCWRPTRRGRRRHQGAGDARLGAPLQHMRMHTALHVMSAVIKGNVTGGQVNADKSRLDFNLEGEVPTKEWVTEEINKILAVDRPVVPQWVTDEEAELAARAGEDHERAPADGARPVRLLSIEGVDLQACGGTMSRRPPRSARSSASRSRTRGR
jgi:misacylated tRNA(Ala) deacylase